MAGNVWEWTSTLHHFYPYVADDGRENMSSAGHQVARGGAFFLNPNYVRCAVRVRCNPIGCDRLGEFRVVVSVRRDRLA